jgi:signal transduction histidine kinase
MKEHHVLTLRMNRHEGSRISNLLNNHTQMYFTPEGRNFMKLSLKKRKNIVRDVNNAVKLISYMADNIGLITGSIKTEIINTQLSRVDIFDLLFKWRIMFRHLLRYRNLDIIVPRHEEENFPWFLSYNSYDGSPSKYIRTHYGLFELLIYNIVDNAVKYAYRGSKIYLSWNESKKNSCYELQISSFGPELPLKDSIFDLYIRGDLKKFTPVEGDGIGLYVVERVGELLGLGKITHTSVLLNESFYLPLVDWYIKEPFNDTESKNKQKQLRDFINNDCNIKWDDILNCSIRTAIDRQRDLSKEYLNKRINIGTWLTTFTVPVPYKIVQ